MIQKFEKFISINEETKKLKLTKKIFSRYVIGDDDLDDIEDYFDLCAELSFNIAKSLKLIDKDDIQKTGNEIDYVATMNDWLSFASDEDKDNIINKFK